MDRGVMVAAATLADLITARPVVVWAAAPRSTWMRDDYQGTARMEAPAPATGLAVTSGISVSQVMPPSHPPSYFFWIYSCCICPSRASSLFLSQDEV
jgi:hypothetical protein